MSRNEAWYCKDYKRRFDVKPSRREWLLRLAFTHTIGNSVARVETSSVQSEQVCL